MDYINKSNIASNNTNSDKESINKLILKFQTNLIQIGYKSERLSIHEFSDFQHTNTDEKFREFFTFLSEIINERNAVSLMIPKNDLKILEIIKIEEENKIEKENKLNFSDSNLEENLLELEIKQLEREIDSLENQLEDENILYEIEKEEEKDLNSGLEKYKERLNNIQKSFDEEISEFERKIFNTFIKILFLFLINSFNIV
jgi:hypothetical protein